MGLKRYDPYPEVPMVQDDEQGRYCRCSDVEELEQKYKDVLMLMEDQYIKKPDPEEARKAVENFERLSVWNSQIKSSPRRDAYPEAAIKVYSDLSEARAALLRLMGVEVK